MNRERVTLARPALGSRLLAHLRNRSARRADEVLVVPSSANRRPGYREVRRADELWWVSTREHPDVVEADLPTGPDDALPRRVRVQLHWWAHDPPIVARRRPVDGLSFVHRDVENRVRKAAAEVRGADEGRLQDELDAALAQPVALPEIGLSYRSAGVFLQAEEIPDDVRAAWGTARWAVSLHQEEQRLLRARLDFHQELIRAGPEALVAYWLTRFPEQIRAVLDYLDTHRPAEDPDRTLSTEVLALLADADDFERNQLRRSIVAGLAGSGPRGMRVVEELGLLEPPEGDEDGR